MFLDIDECANVDCENGGTCVQGINKYFCRCPFGVSGFHCENRKMTRDFVFWCKAPRFFLCGSTSIFICVSGDIRCVLLSSVAHVSYISVFERGQLC